MNIEHPEYIFKCDSISEVVDKKTLDLFVGVGNKYITSLSLTYARQVFKALELFLVDFLPTCTKAPATKLLNGQITQARQYKVIGTEVECTVTFNDFDSWLKENFAERSVSTLNRHRRGINWWIGKLSTEGVLPQGLGIRSELQRGDRSYDSRSPSKTLVDFELPGNAERELQDLATQFVGEDVEEEARVLFNNIASELEEHNLETAEVDVPALVAQILKDRLDLIRAHAESQYKAARAKRLEGLLKVRRGHAFLPLITRFMDWMKSGGQGKANPHRQDVENMSSEDFDDGMLAWCWYRGDGIFFRWGYHQSSQYQRYQRAKKKVGSNLNAELAQELIGCSRQMLIAVQIALVHDYAANVSSIRQLENSDCYDTIAGVSGVLAYKKRANRTLTLLDEIEDGMTPPSKMFRCVKNATRKYRQHCTLADNNRLFLMSFQNSTSARSRGNQGTRSKPVSSPTDNWWNEHSKAFIKTASSNAWEGTTKSIRNSILLLEALNGGVASVREKAQHKGTAVSTVYSDKLAMRIKLDGEMRKFLGWLQTLVAVDVDSFARKINISEVEFTKRKEDILNSHFGGLHCNDPKGGVQPNTEPGEMCGEISKCMICPNRSHLFIVTENNLVHLLLWNAALIENYRNARLGENLSREWKMWGYFIRSVFDMVESNVAYRAVLASAKKKVQDITDKGNPYNEYFRVED